MWFEGGNYFSHCHMSNLRNEYVTFHYIFSPHVTCHYALCDIFNLRNAHVAASILGVKSHTGSECRVWVQFVIRPC